MVTVSLNPANSMDRYELAREFAFIRARDEINNLTDPAQLKEVAIGMLKINVGLREYIHKLAAEIPVTEKLPPKPD